MPYLEGKYVLLRSDNTSTVNHIYHQGGTKSSRLLGVKGPPDVGRPPSDERPDLVYGRAEQTYTLARSLHQESGTSTQTQCTPGQDRGGSCQERPALTDGGMVKAPRPTTVGSCSFTGVRGRAKTQSTAWCL